MSEIDVPLKLSRMLLPMNCGMGVSLMCPTFEFGAVLPCACAEGQEATSEVPYGEVRLSRLS